MEATIEDKKDHASYEELRVMKKIFLEKKNEMNQLLLSVQEGLLVMDKAIVKLDQVIEKPEMIDEIVGSKDEY